MTIFDVIRYPISNRITLNGIKGLTEIRTDFPELYDKWLVNHWDNFSKSNNVFSPRVSAKPVVDELRRMLLEYDNDYDENNENVDRK